MSNFKKDKIYTTRDYSRFKKQLNRDTTTTGAERHIRKLMVKFKQIPIGIPIIVEPDGVTIIEGQHTLEAYRRLRYPVSYIICIKPQGEEAILSLNTTAKLWTTGDYLSFNLNRERTKFPIGHETKPYHVYNWFRTRYKLAHRSVLELLCNVGSGVKPDAMFKNGTLELGNIQNAKEAAEYILALKALTPEYKNRSFITAMLSVMQTRQFNRKRWLQKLKLNSRMLVHSTNAYDYMQSINHIYNWNARQQFNFTLKNEKSSGAASRARRVA